MKKKAIFEEIVTEDFPKIDKHINPLTQKTYWSYFKKSTPVHITVNVKNIQLFSTHSHYQKEQS